MKFVIFRSHIFYHGFIKKPTVRYVPLYIFGNFADKIEGKSRKYDILSYR